jgi:glycosyltransferase involved in cell wall biosynthesis
MHSQKISVLFLPSWYPNRTYPSHGIFVKRHAQAISKQVTVTVIYACSDAGLKQPFEMEEKMEDGLREVIVYYKKVEHSIPVYSSLVKFSRYWRAYKKAYRQVLSRQAKPELVHLNIIFPAAIFATWLSRVEKIPLVITEQWSGYFPEDGNYKGIFLRYMTRKGVRQAKAVITVSESLRDAMQAHHLENNYFILPNVVNTSLFKPQEGKKISGAKKRMLHVSTVNDKEKNISGMLRAIENTSRHRSDFVLEIVGDGPERIVFEQQALELGIKDTCVFFSGYKDAAEVAERMRQSDFYLMFSNYETFSTVIVEALAAGIPVVATSVGVLPSIIGHGVGIMVKPKDEEALALAIDRMLDEYSSYDPHRLNELAEQYFVQGNMGVKFEKIYKQALSN